MRLPNARYLLYNLPINNIKYFYSFDLTSIATVIFGPQSGMVSSPFNNVLPSGDVFNEYLAGLLVRIQNGLDKLKTYRLLFIIIKDMNTMNIAVIYYKAIYVQVHYIAPYCFIMLSKNVMSFTIEKPLLITWIQDKIKIFQLIPTLLPITRLYLLLTLQCNVM